jgi:wobble nucleotide-excising tRNase
LIRRIDFLRNFGIFKNYAGDEASGVLEFAKYNLIYGWNYSGKTTLSRVFQALERKALEQKYLAASLSITQTDGPAINSGNLESSPTIRVFNRDFVSSNFSQEDSAPAVFILGEENAKMKARLAQLKVRMARIEQLADNFAAQKNSVEAIISKLGTDKARDIGDQLGARNFRRPKLEERIIEIRNDPDSHVLSDEVVQVRLATLHSSGEFSELVNISPKIPDLLELAKNVNTLLDQTASNKAIEALKRDARLEGWVREGLALHKGTDKCRFCDSELTPARMTLLSEHFSKAYEDLSIGLENQISELQKINLAIEIYDEMRFMPDVRQELSLRKHSLDEWSSWAKTIRDEFVALLTKKKAAIEVRVLWGGSLDRSTEGQTDINNVNLAITRHNSMVRGIDQEKLNARDALERHYTANYFKTSEIAQKEKDVASFSDRHEAAENVKTKILEATRKIESRISRSAIGASKLNDFLKYLLPDSNIEVSNVGDVEFKFMRGDSAATNLSDGERTAVTFAYFLTRLEADGGSHENAILFIDDPISSFDSNHIYAVYALIAEKLEDSHQLFVSTHNSEFFNLLKSRWLSNRDIKYKRTSRAYYVRRSTDSQGIVNSMVANLPPLLLKYKSEYEFVFSHLYSFGKASNPSEHEAYTAPNLLRKFLEAYLGFRKPSVTVWHEKLNLLLEAPEQRREIQKFVDDASHLQSLNRMLTQPAFISSSQRCVQQVLQALENKDNEHYVSLVETIASVS